MTHSCRYDLRGLAKRALITDVGKTEITHTLPNLNFNALLVFIKKRGKKGRSICAFSFFNAHVDFLHGIFCMKL